MAVKDVKTKHRSRKPFELGFDPSVYNPTGLGAKDKRGEFRITDEELKREYARLSREARERLRKLGQSEFNQTKTYKDNVGKFKTLNKIKDRRELERLTQEAARFVTAKGSSASGLREIRRKAIQTLHDESGYTFVNTKNYQDWVDYLEWLHAQTDKTMFYEVLKGVKEGSKKARKEAAEKQRVLFELWRGGNTEGQTVKEESKEPDEEEEEEVSEDLRDPETTKQRGRRKSASQKNKNRRHRPKRRAKG